MLVHYDCVRVPLSGHGCRVHVFEMRRGGFVFGATRRQDGTAQ